MATVLIALPDGDGWRLHETGLQGDFDVEAGGLVVPFSSRENAVDCLRIVVQTLRAEDGNG